jgi:uncharacterized membrane protein
MLRSVLIGALTGARSMTPLATVSDAARRDALPAETGAPALLGHPAVVAGALALAAGEIGGDKWRHAPDRIVLAGMAARMVTGAVAGAALARGDQRSTAAVLGAAAAVGAAYLTFALRMRAMRRFGQVPTGFAEDTLVVAGSWWVVNRMGRAG